MNRPAWRIMSEELKPCPFCGGEVTRTVEKSYRYVSCENYDCFAVVEAGALSGSEEEAIKMWNTRKGEDERIAQAVAAERARITKDVAGAARRYAGTVSTKPFEGGWKEGALHFAETARQIVNQTKKEKA